MAAVVHSQQQALVAGVNPVQPVQTKAGPIDDIIANLIKGVLDKSLSSVFGDLSDRIGNQINGIINNAADNASRLITQTSFEVSAEIENAKQALNDSLSTNIANVSQQVQNVVGRLIYMVQQVEKKQLDVLADVEQSCMDVVSMIPFADKETRVTKVSTAIAVPHNSTTAKVSVRGLFLFTTDYPPILTIGDHVCQASNVRDTRIDFDVPVTTLLTPEQLASSGRTYSFVKAAFSAPWASWWGGVWKTKHEANYPVGLGVLPATPGKITVTLVATSSGQEVNPYTSNSRFVFNEHRAADKVVTEVFYPTPGFKFKGNPNFALESHIGLYQLKSVVISPTGDQCAVSILLGGGDWSRVGRVHFHLTGEEARDIQVNTTSTVTIDNLLWGDRTTVPRADNQKIKLIHFEAFDGSKVDFQPVSDDSNPFLDITVVDSEVMIAAKVPSEGDIKHIAELKSHLHSKKADLDAKIARLKAEKEAINKEVQDLKLSNADVAGKTAQQIQELKSQLEEKRNTLMRKECSINNDLLRATQALAKLEKTIKTFLKEQDKPEEKKDPK